MRLYRFVAGLIGWSALVLQYVLILQALPGRALFATINFFSYFTILSNLLAALALTLFMSRLFQSAGLRTAIALYMTVTGLIYTTILQGLWAPQGWAFVADSLLHYVMPVLYLIDWIFFVDKRGLPYRQAAGWLVFPALYAAYSLLRGPVADWYPYPFLDPRGQGYGGVSLSVVLVVALFCLLALAMVWIGRRLNPRMENIQS